MKNLLFLIILICFCGCKPSPETIVRKLIDEPDKSRELVYGKTVSEIIELLPSKPSQIIPFDEPPGTLVGVWIVGYYGKNKEEQGFTLVFIRKSIPEKLKNLRESWPIEEIMKLRVAYAGPPEDDIY